MRMLVDMKDKLKNVKLTPIKTVCGVLIVQAAKNMPNSRRKKMSRKKFSSTSNNTFYNLSSTKSKIRVNSIKKAVKMNKKKIKVFPLKFNNFSVQMEKTLSVTQGRTPPKPKMRFEEQKYDDGRPICLTSLEIKDDSLSTSRYYLLLTSSVSSIDDFTNDDGSTNNIPTKSKN